MTADVIILGLGAMGSAAAFHLARRGVKVIGIEQFAVAHDRGSSHGKSRMIRLAYYEHPNYVPLLRRSYENWGELEQFAGQKLLHRTGGLYLGMPGCELIEGSRRAAREHSIEHEMLSRRDLIYRFPQFSPPENAVGIFEPAAGFLLPEDAIRAHVRLAQQHGAAIVESQRVIDWSSDSRGITVRTASATFHADQLILTAGAWMPQLAPALASKLAVTRQVLAWFAPPDPKPLRLGSLPVWAIDFPSGGLHYGFPITDPADGFKCAFHRPAAVADPDALDRSLHPRDVDDIRSVVDEWIPGACGRVLRHAVCMYTNSPDGHFIIDRLPNSERVHFASCCSGHGFKFASFIGEFLADLATEGKTRFPVDFLRLARNLVR